LAAIGHKNNGLLSRILDGGATTSQATIRNPMGCAIVDDNLIVAPTGFSHNYACKTLAFNG
jgi:hypothetical protein